MGQQRLIAIIPYGLGVNNKINSAEDIEIQTWHNFLQRQKLFDIELHGVRP